MGSAALFQVLLAMATVVAASQLAGRFFRKLRQPVVVGEMLAGVALGPSLLGRIAPRVQSVLIPESVTPHLRVISQLGVVLFMFLVGLELDTAELRKRLRPAISISLSSIVVPLGVGTIVALGIRERLAPPGVDPFSFVAFVAVAMSVTAFPVLARIVAERGIRDTPVGILALTCAAAGDVVAWCLLAVLAGIAHGSHGSGIVTIALAGGYVLCMAFPVRMFLVRLAERAERSGTVTRSAVSQIFLGVLLSSLATEWIGIHALFGAFLFGALIPASGHLARALTDKVEDLVGMILLPIFFAFTGLRTQLSSIADASAWALCGLIVFAAFVGKLGGVTLTARMVGVPLRQATALGILMNTRGLMELVVLNIGLDLGIISRPFFAMMVVMALVTTFVTGPLLDWIGSLSEANADAPPEATESVV